MKESLPIKKEFKLQTLGENLGIVLHTLQVENPNKFKEIEDILKSALPEFEELTTGLTSHEPGKTYIRIKEKNLKISTPAWGMSDGTLRLLGHLVVLYLPTPPPLVCIEEPENYVHPRLLELIVDLAKTASEKTQVLITTHSPYLVDFLEPEDLVIVEKKQGETEVRTLEDKEAIKEALKTLTLGEMWYSGDIGGVP
jgi:predicted ATPase